MSAPYRCPSCGGLNTSCPDGCGRDPKTGELNGTRLEPSALAGELERLRGDGDDSHLVAMRKMRERGHFIDQHFDTILAALQSADETVAVLREARDWMKQASDWLLSTDLDMQCPMETDPLDIIDRINTVLNRRQS